MGKYMHVAFWMVFASCLPAMGCSTQKEPKMPTIQVAIGMSEQEVVEYSTAELHRQGDRVAGSFSMDTPFTLEYRSGEDRLTLEGIGGDDYRTTIVLLDGKVSNVSVTPQSRLLTLDEAILRTRELADLLEGAGFGALPESSWFRVWDWNRRGAHMKPAAATLHDARTLLYDRDVMISEASLYAASKGDLSAIVAARNGRRMHALAGNKAANEEGAATAHEWTLELSLVQSGTGEVEATTVVDPI